MSGEWEGDADNYFSPFDWIWEAHEGEWSTESRKPCGCWQFRVTGLRPQLYCTRAWNSLIQVGYWPQLYCTRPGIHWFRLATGLSYTARGLEFIDSGWLLASVILHQAWNSLIQVGYWPQLYCTRPGIHWFRLATGLSYTAPGLEFIDLGWLLASVILHQAWNSLIQVGYWPQLYCTSPGIHWFRLATGLSSPGMDFIDLDWLLASVILHQAWNPLIQVGYWPQLYCTRPGIHWFRLATGLSYTAPGLDFIDSGWLLASVILHQTWNSLIQVDYWPQLYCTRHGIHWFRLATGLSYTAPGLEFIDSGWLLASVILHQTWNSLIQVGYWPQLYCTRPGIHWFRLATGLSYTAPGLEFIDSGWLLASVILHQAWNSLIQVGYWPQLYCIRPGIHWFRLATGLSYTAPGLEFIDSEWDVLPCNWPLTSFTLGLERLRVEHNWCRAICCARDGTTTKMCPIEA